MSRAAVPCPDPLLRVLAAPQDRDGPDRAGSGLAVRRLEDWDLLLQQARPNQLLSRVAQLVEDEGLWPAVPAAARAHLDTALQLARKHRRDVLWELRQIARDLAAPSDLSGAAPGSAIEGPVVLLKGAAYVAADLPAGRGRIFSDIDIMVPEPQLAAAEAALLRAHWRHTKLDPYDQHYYRAWTHQLPPLQHLFRHSVLDLHHTIVPKTARIALVADQLFAAAQPLAAPHPYGIPYRVLAPEDMVLHSAVHLFNDGEFSHGLRDLFDLRDLIADFSRKAGFWERLEARAIQLDLRRPAAYALRALSRVLGLRYGPAAAPLAAWLPPRPLRAIMDGLFDEALGPDHIRRRGPIPDGVDWLLDARGHALRMPAHLLIPHLTRKLFRRTQDDEAPAPGLRLLDRPDPGVRSGADAGADSGAGSGAGPPAS